MLPKLKILLLMAMIVAESWSASTTAPPIQASTSTSTLPPNELQDLLNELNPSREVFKENFIKAKKILSTVIRDFNKKLTQVLLQGQAVKKENTVFSSLSIHCAMMMAYFAAEEGSESQQQMARGLCLPRTPAGIKDLLFRYYGALNYFKSPKSQVAVVNKLYTESDRIHPAYPEFMRIFFKASAEKLPNNLADAAAAINDFIKLKTRGMIETLVDPESLSGNDRVVLVNAIFHSGKWQIPFEEKDTKPMEFISPDGRRTDYPYGMRLKSEKLQYADTPFGKVLELGYEEEGTAMYITLPKENTEESIKEAAEGFDFGHVKRNLECVKGGIKVIMPRFKTTFRRELAADMEALGITHVFNEFTAKLYNLVPEPIAISKFIHQTTIEVDEKGSTAAAATTIVICSRETDKSVEFHVTRPFVVTIMDKRRGITLFHGVIFDLDEELIN